MSPLRFKSPRPRFGLKPYLVILALLACEQKAVTSRVGMAVPAELLESSQSLHETSARVFSYAQPHVNNHLLPMGDDEALVHDRVVFHVESSQPLRQGLRRMRRSFSPGERVDLALDADLRLRIESAPRDEGRLLVDMTFVDVATGEVESRRQELTLPALLEWTPTMEGPSYALRFRRHRPIKLVLDGDPLSWWMGGDWDQRTRWTPRG